MPWGNSFSWLDATVTVPVTRPQELHQDLSDFYVAPNDPRWGGQLCRVLYHESIHFWHVLSSAYLANMAQAEWIRLMRFEREGDLEPTGEELRGWTDTGVDRPFSAKELMECWARYWDVHTRSPSRIIHEEGLEPVPPSDVQRVGAPDDAYTSLHFDRFMQQGRDAAVYARPYRWALERVEGHSRLLNVVFPVIVFCAFGSPDPVGVFMSALDLARRSPVIRQKMGDQASSVNDLWLLTYRTVISESVAPTIRDMGLPIFTGGWDVIQRGRLSDHPIYSTYLRRINWAMGSTKLFNQDPPADDSTRERMRFLSATFAASDARVLFVFPGQPTFRAHLGRIVPPPRIRFKDSTFLAERKFGMEALTKLRASTGEGEEEAYLTLAAEYEDLDRRIKRFRAADYARRRGLPLDTFE